MSEEESKGLIRQLIRNRSPPSRTKRQIIHREDIKNSREMAVAIVQAEIIAEALTGEIITPTTQTIPDVSVFDRRFERLERITTRSAIEQQRTNTVDELGLIYTRLRRVIYSTKAGELNEIVFKSDSDSYTLKVIVDAKTLIERSFAQLQSIADYSQVVDAYYDEEEDPAVYVLNLSGIKWTEEFSLTIIVNENEEVLFHNVFGTWNENI